MDAPVVPTRLARTAPTASIVVLASGVPASEPRRCTPPEITKSEASSVMKAAYSRALRRSQGVPPCQQRAMATGRPKAAARASLFRLRRQKAGRARGTRASDAR